MRTIVSGKVVSMLLLVGVAVGCGGGSGDPSDEGSGGSGGSAAGSGGVSSGGSGGTGGGTGGTETMPDPCGEYEVDLTDFAATNAAATRLTGEWGGIRELFGVGEDLYLLGADLSVVRGDATEREVLGTDVPALPFGGFIDGRRRLIVDATHAYFATEAGVARIDLATGVTETVFDGAGEARTSDLWLADGELLFTLYGGEESGIYRVPVDGSAAPTLVTDELEPLGFSYANGSIYAGAPNYTISSVPLAGGTPTTITDQSSGIFPDYKFVTATEGQLFWSDGGTLLSCSLADCSSPTRLSPRASDGLVLHGDRLYWQTDSVGWISADGASCKNLVFGDWPDNVGLWGVTDNYVYLAGRFDGDFEPAVLLRLTP